MRGLGQSNLSHHFYAYNAAGQIWNGSAFVAKVAASFATYRISATKASDASDASVQEWFTATTPAGTSFYEMRETGATLALSYVVWEDTTKTDDIGTVRAQVRW